MVWCPHVRDQPWQPTSGALRLPRLQGLQSTRRLKWSRNLLQAAIDGESVPWCSTIIGTSPSGKKFVRESRPQLSGISAKRPTTLTCSKSSDERPTKKLRSVSSSSALFSNTAGSSKPEEKEEALKPEEKEEARKPEQKEAPKPEAKQEEQDRAPAASLSHVSEKF